MPPISMDLQIQIPPTHTGFVRSLEYSNQHASEWIFGSALVPQNTKLFPSPQNILEFAYFHSYDRNCNLNISNSY